MRKIHCRGCGMTEDVDQSDHDIKSVTLLVINDPRFDTANVKYTEDLCTPCTDNLLHNYFGVTAEGKLDIPAFLQPRRQVTGELRAV